MDSAEIKKDMTADQALVRITKGLEKETADKIRELDMYGLQLAENTKRYYPLGNFASQLLGSVNDDGAGRTGVESMFKKFDNCINFLSITSTIYECTSKA